MSMVVHPADFMRQNLFFAANTGHVGPEFFPVVQWNKLAALLGAENNMNKVLYVRVGHALLFLSRVCVAPTALEKS
jgi:uncharacterized membrane protein YuzA (DUF378 family)